MPRIQTKSCVVVVAAVVAVKGLAKTLVLVLTCCNEWRSYML